MRNDSIVFHEYYRKFYNEVFFPYLKENKIDQVFQLGDLFDRRKFINFNSLHLSRKYFFDKFKEHGLTLTTLLGNHDIFFRNTLEVNSSQQLLSDYKEINIHDKPVTVDVDGIPIDIIPWICDDNLEDVTTFIKKSKTQICFGHFEISGFVMDSGNVCHEGLSKKILSRYDVVLSGHFHHKSTDGQITYVGTPGEMTWGDCDDPRGFHVFDTETRELTFVQNPYKMFHKIYYDDLEQDHEFWNIFNYDNLKDSYVKIVVMNKQNPYLFDTLIDNLHKAEAADISIVEDFTDITEGVDDIIDQADDTMTTLNKFIDDLSLNVEADKLKTVMRELYIESLNVGATE